MTWIKLSFILVTFVASGLISLPAVAQSPSEIVLEDSQAQYNIGLQMEILEDKEKQWTIEDVTSLEVAAQFVPSLEESPGFGFTDSAYWIRFQVRNEASADTDWLLVYEAAAFYIDYYFPAADGEGYDVIHTGSALPFDTRDVPVGRFAFQVPIQLQESKTVYMRFASGGTLILALTLLSEGTFTQQALTQQVVNGVLYGVLLILAIYNLVLFLTLHDRSYLYYVLFFGTILIGIMALDGFAAQYLWPNQGLFAAISTRLFMVMSFALALLFATSFLRTKEFSPRLHWVMIALSVTIFVLLSLQIVWFRATAVIHVFLMIMSCTVMIIAGVVVWRKGYYPARYFLFGWVVVLVGFIIFILTLVDVAPYTELSDSILRLGLIVLALVLSIGLAKRINIFRQEKVAAQFSIAAQRTQIAQDLHDSVTQSLYSANLFAEAGRETAEAGDVRGASHYFSRIGDTTQQALKEMRLFLYELRPPDVVEDGLVDALQKRLDTVEKRSGMEARLRLDGSTTFPEEIGDQFYRIAQEALNNVVKHAEADEVNVFLRADNGIMGLEIVDNGRGFDPEEADQAGGMGLQTMRERAAQINGRFNIDTAPGQGTSIQVKIDRNDD
jgi:signal transduction histidine kinase